MYRFIGAAILACFVAHSCLGADEPKIDPRTEVATAIPEAIRLLEAKKYKEVLEKFVPPDDLARATKDKSLDEFAEQFEKEHAAAFLIGLKSIQGKTPKLNDAGDEATFQAKFEDRTREMKWVKVDKFWYVK